ncbi:MAG: hypothetical protein ACW98Y_01950 [Candidatus Thorarchaeota archaeon]|jgi:hypothetical protein
MNRYVLNGIVLLIISSIMIVVSIRTMGFYNGLPLIQYPYNLFLVIGVIIFILGMARVITAIRE